MDDKSIKRDDSDVLVDTEDNIQLSHDYSNHNSQEIANGNQQSSRARPTKIDNQMFFSHCHVQDDANSLSSTDSHGHGNDRHGVDKSARRRLVMASIICLVFMIGELVGGILSNSLAIAADAAHLLTDFASFMVSLLALWLSSRPATRKMSFGWYRAEVIGALLSVLMIWLVTGLLVYMAVERLRTQQFEIDAMVMVITAAAGLVVNIIMAIALNVDGHSHGFHSHGHGHSHGDHHNHNHDDSHSHDHDQSQIKNEQSNLLQHDVESGSDTAYGSVTTKARQNKGNRGKDNINVRAAFIHVLGDFLQSVGVLIAALVIYFRPDYAIVDPICTFLFSIIVLVTTINIIRDAVNVLMEGMPDGINFIEVRESLGKLNGVTRVHNLRIWSLSLDKIAVSAHLVVDGTITGSEALKMAVDMLKTNYDFFEITIQVEDLKDDMRDCQHCQEEIVPVTSS